MCLEMRTMKRFWRAHGCGHSSSFPSFSLSFFLSFSLCLYNCSRSGLDGEVESGVETKRFYVLKSTCQDLPRLAKVGFVPRTAIPPQYFRFARLWALCISDLRCSHTLAWFVVPGWTLCRPLHLWILSNNRMQNTEYTSITFRHMNQIGSKKDPLRPFVCLLGSWRLAKPPSHGPTWVHVGPPSGDRSNSKRATAGVSSTEHTECTECTECTEPLSFFPNASKRKDF